MKAIRIVAAVPGVLFLLSGLGWIVDPAGAAANLGAPLLDGVARSTQIGDTGAFFLAAGTSILLGAWTARPAWLQAGALLFGYAAVMRTLAWLLHDAPFTTHFIVVEVFVAALLVFLASRLTSSPHPAGS